LPRRVMTPSYDRGSGRLGCDFRHAHDLQDQLEGRPYVSRPTRTRQGEGSFPCCPGGERVRWRRRVHRAALGPRYRTAVIVGFFLPPGGSGLDSSNPRDTSTFVRRRAASSVEPKSIAESNSRIRFHVADDACAPDACSSTAELISLRDVFSRGGGAIRVEPLDLLVRWRLRVSWGKL